MGRLLLCVALVCGTGSFRSSMAADSEIDFANHIKPILSRHCGDCHGSEEQNGGLRFDIRSAAFAQNDSGGHAIVPGNVEASGLIGRITSRDENERMPPEGEPLSAADIKLISEWIAAGAPWREAPRGETSDRTPHSHWSFQPLARPKLPAVQDSTWPLSELDLFIQTERERLGLTVAPDADPVVLVRRITFGLTGLPPTPDEVSNFVSLARSPRGLDVAVTEWVDELLSRSSYGERWGRHWMDWVRYADTAGDNSDFPIPQAYLYRNYIIDSFNADLPYDQFLTEQLAGDLLPADSQAERNRLDIATGYVAMARRFGSLLERYPWHLTIEDTIDNVGRTMMGLTLSCARCHDHKFDPITTRDYYGLYGIFSSTRYAQPGLELFQAQNDFVPLLPQDQAKTLTRPFDAETKKRTEKLEQLLSACQQHAVENASAESTATLTEQRKMRDELDAMLIKARKAGEELAEHLKKIPTIPTAYAVRDAEPENARIQIKGEPFRPGAEVPRKFPDILGGQMLPEEVAATGSGRLQLARWITDPDNPLTARVIVNRVWQRHFGVGIVPSSSDFGLRGEPPTHPELLDWLAGEFIGSGWSIKHLQRLIMTSRTYRMSSQGFGENVTIDPANQYHWRFNRQRLDAESIRDAVMMIAGSLDRTPQSEPYPIPPQTQWEYTQHHPFKDTYPSNRRSVYLMTKRLTAQTYFQTFDGPDPNVCTSDRDQSVTPLQALYFVNDQSLHEQAAEYARSLLRETSGDSQRATLAFRTIICRHPSADELSLMLQHVDAVRRQMDDNPQIQIIAWSSLTRSLFRLNEFLYVD